VSNLIPAPIKSLFSRTSEVAGGIGQPQGIVPTVGGANQIMNQMTTNRSSGGSYVFSPTIHVNGGGGQSEIATTVKTQIGNCYKDFEKFMQRYEQQKMRTAVV